MLPSMVVCVDGQRSPQTKTQFSIMKKQYKTEDGFTFILQSDGTLTDGDLVFDSLDELKKHVNIQEVENNYEN